MYLNELVPLVQINRLNIKSHIIFCTASFEKWSDSIMQDQANEQPPSGSGEPPNDGKPTAKSMSYDFNAHVQAQYAKEGRTIEAEENIDKNQPMWECVLLRWCEGYHTCGVLIGIVLAAFAFTAGVRATQLSQALADTGGISQITTLDSFRIVLCTFSNV